MLFHLDHGEQPRQVGVVVAGQGKAHAHLHARIAAEPQCRHRGIERTGAAAEPVVRVAATVETDADVVETDVGDAIDVRCVDQRAVGGEPDVEAHRLGAPRDVEDIGTQQRLAARQDQHRHMERLEIVHHRKHFGRAEFAREIVIGGDGVAVLAGEIAAPDQVPDHHRPGRIAARPDRSRRDDLLHELR